MSTMESTEGKKGVTALFYVLSIFSSLPLIIFLSLVKSSLFKKAEIKTSLSQRGFYNLLAYATLSPNNLDSDKDNLRITSSKKTRTLYSTKEKNKTSETFSLPLVLFVSYCFLAAVFRSSRSHIDIQFRRKFSLHMQQI